MKKVCIILTVLAVVTLGLIAGSQETSAGSGSVSITDNRGKEVVMDGYAETFVLFPNEGVEMLSITRSTEGFLGMNPVNQRDIAGMVTPQYYPELLEISTTMVQGGSGFVPNMEELLVLGPDVAYQWNFGGPERWEPIEEAGIPVITVGWGDLPDDHERYTLYAAALGKAQRAQEILDWHAQDAQRVKAVTDTISRDKLQNHVWLSRINGNMYSIRGTEQPLASIHKVANAAFTLGGLTNPGADVSLETLLDWDPDLLILNTWASPKLSVESIMNEALLQELSAVKNRRVYESPAASQLVHAPLTWRWYAMTAYPDLFPEHDLRQQVKDDYKRVFNIDLTEEDVDNILNVEENRNSAGYERFMR